jgi:hypothetical protein
MCGICGQPCANAASLKAHNKVHTHGKPFSCGKCGKDFVKKVPFLKHVEACRRAGDLVASSSRDEKRG